MLEQELRKFVKLGQINQKHNKFSHRMTERRLHELYDDQLLIEEARFETFHAKELEAAVPPGHSRDLDGAWKWLNNCNRRSGKQVQTLRAVVRLAQGYSTCCTFPKKQDDPHWEENTRTGSRPLP